MVTSIIILITINSNSAINVPLIILSLQDKISLFLLDIKNENINMTKINKVTYSSGILMTQITVDIKSPGYGLNNRVTAKLDSQFLVDDPAD